MATLVEDEVHDNREGFVLEQERKKQGEKETKRGRNSKLKALKGS